MESNVSRNERNELTNVLSRYRDRDPSFLPLPLPRGRSPNLEINKKEIENLKIILSYSFIRSFIHSFIHSFICSFIHLFVHSFVCSFIRLFVHSFVCLFICSYSGGKNKPFFMAFFKWAWQKVKVLTRP